MLDPLAHATRLITEAARTLESEKLSDVVFDLDQLARKIEATRQFREVRDAARVERLNQEFAQYEARFNPCRDLIGAAWASAERTA